MRLSFTVTHEKTRTLVTLIGWIDERAEWPELNEPLRGDLVLDLEGVSLLNSMGVREWIRWLNALKVKGDVVLINCSPAVVKQINILEGFINDRTKIETIFVPYFCEDCAFEVNQLIEVAKLTVPPPGNIVLQDMKCPKCGMNMELDMIESQYLSFLSAQRAKFS